MGGFARRQPRTGRYDIGAAVLGNPDLSVLWRGFELAKLSENEVRAAAREIRCLCLDVDGVMTDGRLYTDERGEVTRAFHIHDGLAIKLFGDLIGEVVIISGKASGATRARAAELGIRKLALGTRDKLADLCAMCDEMKLTPRQVAAIGDDLPDLPVLRACGVAIAPANAVAEVRAAAHLVTVRAGGDGAVREAIELLLRGAGRWGEAVARFGG